MSDSDMVKKRQIAALREKLKIREVLHADEIEQLKNDQLSEIRQVRKEAALEGENNALLKIATTGAIPQEKPTLPQSPLLSVLVNDFLKRYDQTNVATYTKLVATLPLLVELVSDKPVNQILQADINRFFDDVQGLPVKRKQKAYDGMTIREIIEANKGGRCISKGTFETTYKACVSIFLSWATTNYRDQGFPSLSVDGAVYRGQRADGINKQRAATTEELEKLFTNPKMKKYRNDREKEHYFWLPLLGLHTGARINELCQLNPQTDIKQDSATGIWYLHITDEGETVENVDKSIKTNSSRRIVPLHSKLIELGFLGY